MVDLPDVNVDQVAINKREIIYALEHDYEFFIQFFMPDLAFPIPDFHPAIFARMVDTHRRKFAAAIPRGHNKTTLAKLATCYIYLFTNYRFGVYTSNTSDVAQAACRDIVEFLQSDNFIAVFGHIKKEIWREGDGLYIFSIPLPNGSWKKCILLALGAEQQIRGRNIDNERPEFGVVDDLEDDDNTSTATQILKLKNWVFGPFFKAFNKWKMKIIWIGNLLSKESLLNSFCDEENTEWDSVRLGAILSNGSVLWPDLWSMDALKADYMEYKKQGLTARWFAEMMNLPIPTAGGLIDANEIRYYPNIFPGDSTVGFITIDPAISEKTWANNTAIVVHMWVDDRWMPVDHEHSKLDPLALIDRALELALKWNVRVIGIESVAYQAALQYFFHYILIERQLLHIKTVQTHKNSRSKTSKLAAWAALIKNGTYWLPEDDIEITEQLLTYDPMKKHNKDDLIDACSQGVEMLENYLVDIMESFELLPRQQVQLSSEFCAI